MNEEYKNGIEHWRNQTEMNLRGEKSWLALTGLYWLEQGENVFGSDPQNAIPFPEGVGPERVGIFRLAENKVSIEVDVGNHVEVEGVPVTTMEIKPDVSGEPDDIDCGRIAMRLVQRGERFGIRMWDRENPRRADFAGRRWFEIDSEYVLQASYTPHDPPRKIPITNIIGDTDDAEMVGFVEFELKGRTARLEAIGSAEGHLFIIFKDATNSRLTYPAGRYLYTDPPQDGRVLVDFNRAYNPPCAFTDFATCSLPPKENHLPFAIEAGEIKPA